RLRRSLTAAPRGALQQRRPGRRNGASAEQRNNEFGDLSAVALRAPLPRPTLRRNRTPGGTDMKAAVMHAPHTPLTIEEVSVAKPKKNEVLVRTAFAGL